MKTIENEDIRKYCVYLITNMVNGKQYAGFTCQGLLTRWGHHCSKATKGVLRSLYAGMRKHGSDSFVPVVFREGLTREEAGREEKLLIRTLKLTDRSFGYNMTQGGEGGVPTEEVVNHICESRGMKRDLAGGNRYFSTNLPTEEIIEQYKSGMSSVDLAKKYGFSPGTILRRLRAAIVTLRTPSERTKLFGERDGYGFKNHPPKRLGSKRSEDTKRKMKDSNKQRRRDVSDEEVVRLYVEGKSSTQIASMFGMTHPAIQRRLRLNDIQLRPPGAH